MEKITNILKEIFDPVEVYKQANIITVVVNSEQNMEEKLSKFSSFISNMDEDFSFRFLTVEEAKDFNFDDLGVKVL